MNIFQQILESSGFGIGLLNKNHELVYANSPLQTLLNSSDSNIIGENAYSILTLTTASYDEIRAQLEENSFWEGIISWSQKAVKARLSNIDISASTSEQNLKSACYILVLSDYSDEFNQQNELVEAKRLAEKSEKAKSEFLSNMTHELRTPLNAILGFSQLMEIDPSLSGEQHDNLKEITSASTNLLKLVNETLESSRVESGKLRLTNEKVQLQELVSECMALLQPLADKRGVSLHYKESKNTLAIDRVRLKQVILNLLSNAIRYNKNGGQVLIQSFPFSNDTIHIEVLDTGKGIAPQFLSSIFTPFKRFSRGHKKIASNGIGLMLARRLVQMMKGKINVVSELNTGSIFWVEFPQNLDKPISFISTKSRKILWFGAESNPVFTKQLTELRPGLEYKTAENPSSLTKLTLNYQPDLVFLAIENPDQYYENYELLQEALKPENSLKETPIIAVISSTLHSKLEALKHPSTAKNIDKPLNVIEFINIIDHYLHT